MGRHQRRREAPAPAVEQKPEATSAWRLRLLSVGVSLLLLVLADVGLRVLGLLPPPDLALLHEQSFARGFSPLVEDGPDHWTIRPDWVNRSETLAFAPGRQPGRVFLQPGFRPARIARRKLAGGVRLVALGASTTFGLYVHAEQAFPQLAGELIQAARPGTRVETINLGCPGWASDRIANLMPVVTSLGPDLVLFYEGHNELLARMDQPLPASAGHRLGGQLLRFSSLFAWAWRAGSAWRAQDARTLDEDTAALAAGQVPVFDPLRLPRDDVQQPTEAEFAQAASRLRRNLETIADACHTARDAARISSLKARISAASWSRFAWVRIWARARSAMA